MSVLGAYLVKEVFLQGDNEKQNAGVCCFGLRKVRSWMLGNITVGLVVMDWSRNEELVVRDGFYNRVFGRSSEIVDNTFL